VVGAFEESVERDEDESGDFAVAHAENDTRSYAGRLAARSRPWIPM
jgi:hypothetical protein